MVLDLSDWAQRRTAFLGRYHELGVQRVLDAALRAGDRFVDIGAHIGMIAACPRLEEGSPWQRPAGVEYGRLCQGGGSHEEGQRTGGR